MTVQKLEAMRENCKRLAQPKAAENMFKLVKELSAPSAEENQ